MVAVKTEAAITFDRLEITTRFQLLPPHFRPEYGRNQKSRHGYDIVDIARHFPTSAVVPIQNGGHGNRTWK